MIKLFFSLISIVNILLVCSCSTPQADNGSDQDFRTITKDSVNQVFNEWKARFEKENGIEIQEEDTFNIILTDLDNDGFTDGIVDFNLFIPKDYNGNWFVGYVFFKNTSNGIKYKAILDGKDRFMGDPQRLEFISNNLGDLTVLAYRYFYDDASCCPSIKTIEHYKFENDKFVLQNIDEEKALLKDEYYSHGKKKVFIGRYIDYSMGDLAHYTFKEENGNEELNVSSLPSYARGVLTTSNPNSEYGEENMNRAFKNKLFKITYREFTPKQQEDYMYPYNGATSIVMIEE